MQEELLMSMLKNSLNYALKTVQETVFVTPLLEFANVTLHGILL